MCTLYTQRHTCIAAYCAAATRRQHQRTRHWRKQQVSFFLLFRLCISFSVRHAWISFFLSLTTPYSSLPNDQMNLCCLPETTHTQWICFVLLFSSSIRFCYGDSMGSFVCAFRVLFSFRLFHKTQHRLECLARPIILLRRPYRRCNRCDMAGCCELEILYIFFFCADIVFYVDGRCSIIL